METESPEVEPFVWRTFEFEGGDRVDIELFRPRPDQNDWRCDYHIRSGDQISSHYAMGVDPLQALLLAIDGAHVRMLERSREQGAALTWLGGAPFDLGLPDSPSVRIFKSP
ncbi:MAG: hypothetical protein EBS42_06245 [Caulobacteraceae bacterium]|jgi:hypothetical protein|nr:hypothetical protein [Caulobacteraceae bacterium]